MIQKLMIQQMVITRAGMRVESERKGKQPAYCKEQRKQESNGFAGL